MNTIIKALLLINDNDPVYNCNLYEDKGCSHVDGMLCDFPQCSMNKNYLRELEDELPRKHL